MLRRVSQQLLNSRNIEALAENLPNAAYVSIDTFKSMNNALPRFFASMGYTTPPPDANRMGTADLCDKYVPEPVDQITERKVQIMPPIFK